MHVSAAHHTCQTETLFYDVLCLWTYLESQSAFVYRDEAARMWQQREAEWARERQARQRLMQEVRIIISNFRI